MKGTTYTVKYRRKLSGKTDYKARRVLLSANKPRLVIRKSLKYITVQLIQYIPEGDKVLISTSSKELTKLGWNFSTKNTPAGYLTGLLCGKKALAKKFDAAVIDLGRQTTNKGNKLFAVIKGLKDAGIKLSINEKIFPSDDRIKGTHIISYSKEAKNNQFVKLKKTVQFDKMESTFNSVEEKILQ